MKRIWALAAKDLLETRRDRLALLFIVVMPLAFTAFFGTLLGGESDRLPLALWIGDSGPSAQALVRAVEGSDALKVTRMDAVEAEKAVDEGDAAAALLIPSGFSATVSSGKPASLTVVGDSGSSGVQTVQTEVYALAGQVVAAERAARAAVTAVAGASAGSQGGGDAEDAALLKARPLASKALARPAATIRVIDAGAATGQVPTGFVLSSPGMLINFILFGIMTAGATFIMERRNFTLLRLMTTRVRRSEVIAGKMAGMFVLTFMQQVILMGVAQLVFGVDYLRNPAALLLMMVALSCFAAALGLMLAALLKSEQALVATTVLVSMAVSALSGAWFPLEITGPTFQFVGHLLPTSWILDGLRGIVVRGFTVQDVLPAFGVVLAWSAGLFAVAVSRFRLAD